MGEIIRLEEQGKPAFKSATIQGNVLAIVASAGVIAAAYNNADGGTVNSAVILAAVGSIWGNLMSIFGRMRATEKIRPASKSQ